MTEETDYESDSELSLDSEATDYSHYEDFDRPRQQRKIIRSSFKDWNIEKQRLLQLKKLTFMKLPQKTIDILSKLIINHQITEIEKLTHLKSSVTITAKVNLENANFRALTDENVVLKIFTKKNHVKPDAEAANNFNVTIYYKDINRAKNEELIKKYSNFYSYSWYEARNHFKDYMIFRIDSIVVVPAKPKTSLMKFIKNHPKRRLDLFEKILEAVRSYRKSDYSFWAGKYSLHDIYFNESENELLILNQKSDHFNDWKGKEFAKNVTVLVKAFNRSGVPMKDLQSLCFKAFRLSHRYAEGYLYQELCDKLDWN